MIYIFSSRKATSLGLEDKSSWAVIIPLGANKNFSTIPQDFKILEEDMVYLDISGISAMELKKFITWTKKRFTGSSWGIIDPKGIASDPALFFFEGAGDYIGPALIKKGLVKKRFTLAGSFSLESKNADRAANRKISPGPLDSRLRDMRATDSKSSDLRAVDKRKNQKLPAGKFEGWKSIRAGTSLPFFFLFITLSGKTNLRSLVGESAFSTVKNRLREVLQQYLREAEALIWMETEENYLLLIPARGANGRAAAEAGLKLILNSRLICIEKLGLSIQAEFTLALHYGKTVYREPGRTGAVISESVNYIFHLGIKRAESGRLTISEDIPEEALPEGILDLFSPAGVFEGIPIRHSRRFT